MTRRLFDLTACLLAVFLAALAGCGGGEPAERSDGGGGPSAGGTLVVGLAAEPDALNVYFARTSASLLLAHRVLPRLAVERMPDERHDAGLAPDLATRWESSEDGRTVTFHLEEGGTWTDGSPMTCDDVRFTWKSQVDPRLAWRGASLKRHIESVDCPDPHAAVFRFGRSYPGMLMDANDLHVLPASLAALPYEEWRAADWAAVMPWGGPFKLVSHVPGQELVLERHEGWPGPPGQPWFERLVLRVVPDQSARVSQLLSGDLDVVLNLRPDDAARVTRAEEVSVLRRPSPAYVYLGWNAVDPEAYADAQRRREARCGEAGADCPDEAAAVARLARSAPHPLFGDPRVRRALTLAIDRESMIDALLLGEGVVPASPILAPLPEHDPSLAPWPHDPVAARRLLAEAGFTDADGNGVLDREGRPFAFDLLVQAGNAQRRDAAVHVQSDLAKVGVDVEIVPIENSAFYATLSKRGMDAWIGSWVTSLRVDMTEMLHADSCGSQGLNFGSFTEPAADEIASRARDLADPAERVDAWHAWEARFHELQPYTMLFHPNRLTGVRAHVKGTDSILPNDDLAGVEGWWLSGR